jgi:hypothetical protein
MALRDLRKQLDASVAHGELIAGEPAYEPDHLVAAATEVLDHLVSLQ